MNRGRAPQSHPSLTLEEVDTAFAGLAATSGKGAGALRVQQFTASSLKLQWKKDACKQSGGDNGVRLSGVSRAVAAGMV